MVLVGLILYILLSRFIVRFTYRKTGSLTKKRIALAIMILIPTWDIIIGYPIFWYLCTFESGMKIYKTVDNVEGFYVGEWKRRFTPRMPDKNYKYIDYKVKESGRFFRSYWLDNNTSEDCYEPRKKDSYKYKDIFYKEGLCFSVKPLQPANVSKYKVIYDHGKGKRIIPFIDIDKFVLLKIKDQLHDGDLGIRLAYRWNRGWLRSTLLNVDGSFGTLCPFKDSNELLIHNTLKSENNYDGGGR